MQAGAFASTAGHLRCAQGGGLLLEPDKSAPPAPTNVFLGVQTHLEGVADEQQPQVVFTPCERRLKGILEKLAECRAADLLSPKEAEVLLGKLQFVRGHSFRGVGRAAMQPLLSRTNKQTYVLPGGGAPPPPTTAFDEPLRVMHDFLRVLLAHLPPLVKRLGARPARKPVLVYSDAQYNSSTGSAGLGVVLVDLDNPDVARFMAGAQTSPEILQWMPKRKQQVNQLELLAALCACTTFADILQDREVVLYIDNTAALSACIHGYGHSPEMGKIANALALLLARLRCTTMFLHVAGKANPADLPSRAPWVTGPSGQPALDVQSVVDEDPQQQARDRVCATALNQACTHRPLAMPTPAGSTTWRTS